LKVLTSHKENNASPCNIKFYKMNISGEISDHRIDTSVSEKSTTEGEVEGFSTHSNCGRSQDEILLHETSRSENGITIDSAEYGNAKCSTDKSNEITEKQRKSSWRNCQFCCEYFSTKMIQTRHFKNTTCKICNVLFACKGLLAQHNHATTFWCKICSKKIHGKELQAEHENKNFCSYCGKSFDCETRLKMHLGHSPLCNKAIKRNENDFETVHRCSKCSMHLKTPKELADHEEKTTCVCGENFKCQTQFSKHLAIFWCGSGKSEDKNKEKIPTQPANNVPEPKKLKCTNCGVKYKKSSGLEEHLKRKFGVEGKCKTCSAHFGCWRALEDHAKVCSPASSGNSPVPEEEINVCDFCSEKYNSSDLHLLAENKCNKCDQEILCQGILNRHQCREKFICSHCDTQFEDKASRSVHEKIWSCPNCGSQTACHSLSIEHQAFCPVRTSSRSPNDLTQTPPQLFCSYCEISCASEDIKASHMEVKNCPRCGYMQPCKSMLEQHLKHCRFQPSEGAHQCPLCFKDFLSAALLGTHVQADHSDAKKINKEKKVTCECEVCGKQCRNQKKLDAHRTRRHPAPKKEFRGESSDSDNVIVIEPPYKKMKIKREKFDSA